MSPSTFDLDARKCAALDVVAKRFSATWQAGTSACPSAYVTLGGKQISVDVASLIRPPGRGGAVKPHLRFDRVATGLVLRLREILQDAVPAGTTVMVSVTAPILVPAKTAAAIEERVRSQLARSTRSRDQHHTLFGNRVRIRIFRDGSPHAPKLVGFVHNPDTDPRGLFDMAKDVLAVLIGDGRGTRPPALDRWLVLVSAAGSAFLEAYRAICAQLSWQGHCEKVLIVFDDGRIGVLSE